MNLCRIGFRLVKSDCYGSRKHRPDCKVGRIQKQHESRMADQLDGMIASNRENIRMKCLEAALKFYELKSKEPLRISNRIDTFEITDKGLKDLAEEFYKFVKGE